MTIEGGVALHEERSASFEGVGGQENEVVALGNGGSEVTSGDGANEEEMAKNASISTSLLEAAGSGDIESIKYHVKRGVDVNATVENGPTPLRVAAGEGHIQAVQYLVERGADVNVGGSYGWTPLLWAAGRGHVGTVRYLVEHGAFVNAIDDEGWTPLLWAALVGNLNVVKYLVEHGADVNAPDDSGGTPLHRAAGKGHLEVVRFLVECGARVDVIDEDGNSPQRDAAGNGHVKVVRFLVERGADVNMKHKKGWTTLQWAAGCGYVEIVRFLVQRGAYVNAADAHGNSPLHWASGGGHIESVRYLVERGAEANAADENGWTSLHRAADGGHIESVRFLVERGANVNATDKDGLIPLLLAAKNGHLAVVRYLLANGANRMITARTGSMALEDAERNGYMEIRRLLLRHVQFDRMTTQKVEAHHSTGALRDWYIAPFEVETRKGVEDRRTSGNFLATWLDTEVVIIPYVPGASSNSFNDEIVLWNKLVHPNVLMMYGACTVGHQYFVCEFASKGSIDEYLRFCKPDLCTPWMILRDTALGLQYLHERNIFHRDLRGSNILIGDDGMAKLAGFKLNRFSDSSSRRNGFNSGEYIRWASPEYLKGEELTAASDIYSLGMCIVEAVTRKKPYHDYDLQLVRRMKEHHESEALFRSRHSDNFGGDEWNLISRMCFGAPNERVAISFVVHQLDQFAELEAVRMKKLQPFSDPDPLSDIDSYESGSVCSMWDEVCELMKQCEDDLFVSIFDAIHTIYSLFQQSKRQVSLLKKFHHLLKDFQGSIDRNSTLNYIERLSCTRINGANLNSIRRRIRLLRDMLETPADDSNYLDFEENFDRQRKQQIQMFVSELSNTYLVLNELETDGDRSAFLSFLRSEIDKHSAHYTNGQLEVMEIAYKDIADQSQESVMSGTTPEWFIPRYELMIEEFDKIGKGGFGEVHRAKWLDSDVVVKQLLMDKDIGPVERCEKREMFVHEANIWFGLSHPHVVRLFGACHVGTPFFVSEYASKGTLSDYLGKKPKMIWQKLAEAARGIEYLHAREIVHGDLKGDNILIGRDGKAKVTDFGLSFMTNQTDGSNTTVSGAVQWVAPECLGKGGVRPTMASDIYSLGMCIVEALFVIEKVEHPFPWRDLPALAVKYHVKVKKLPKQPSRCTREQWHLVKRMCKFDPQERLSITTVVEELDKLATGSFDVQEVLPSFIYEMKFDTESILEKLRQMIRTEQYGERDHRAVPIQVYTLLVNRFDHVRTAFGLKDELRPILQSAQSNLTELVQHSRESYVGETLNALGAYSLHRRLDKLLAAQMILSAAKSEGVHNWQAKCYEFLRVPSNQAVDSVQRIKSRGSKGLD